jgi:hypothetical protein
MSTDDIAAAIRELDLAVERLEAAASPLERPNMRQAFRELAADALVNAGEDDLAERAAAATATGQDRALCAIVRERIATLRRGLT